MCMTPHIPKGTVLPDDIFRMVLTEARNGSATHAELLVYRLVSLAFNKWIQPLAFSQIVITGCRIHEKRYYDDYLRNGREPRRFEAYAVALSKSGLGLLDGSVVKDLTLKASHWENGLGSTIHACTLLRIVEHLPNLQDLSLHYARLAPCPHYPSCSPPFQPPTITCLRMLKLYRCLHEEHIPGEIFNYHEVFRYLHADAFQFKLNHVPWRCDHFPQQRFEAHTLICAAQHDQSLRQFLGVEEVKDLRLWILVTFLRHWEVVATIVRHNSPTLERIFIGSVAVPGKIPPSEYLIAALTAKSDVMGAFGPPLHHIALDRCTALKHATIALAVPDTVDDYQENIWQHILFHTRHLPPGLATLRLVFHFHTDYTHADPKDLVECGLWDALSESINVVSTKLRLEIAFTGNVPADVWEKSCLTNGGYELNARELVSRMLCQMGTSSEPHTIAHPCAILH